MWTTRDIALLRANAPLGAVELARLLETTPRAVRNLAHRQRISLRRRGERRGILLGQPRELRLSELVGERLAADRKTAALVLERSELTAADQLCPECCARPVRVRKTGLCLPCHKRRLADAHRELLAETEAGRELWQARQALKRAREKTAGP